MGYAYGDLSDEARERAWHDFMDSKLGQEWLGDDFMARTDEDLRYAAEAIAAIGGRITDYSIGTDGTSYVEIGLSDRAEGYVEEIESAYIEPLVLPEHVQVRHWAEDTVDRIWQDHYEEIDGWLGRGYAACRSADEEQLSADEYARLAGGDDISGIKDGIRDALQSAFDEIGAALAEEISRDGEDVYTSGNFAGICESQEWEFGPDGTRIG